MERASGLIGAATMICWVIALGPVGAVVLACVAYAMVNGNIVLAAIFTLFALSPVIVNAAWGMVAAISRVKAVRPVPEPTVGYFPLRSNARVMPE